MGFTPKTVESVMLSCGRYCSVCHKFCGTKIETHHIKPKADGGDDSEENCIPLCFDCHADVGGYNDNHPKGRKFTVSELKQHRDFWYKKVRSGGIPSDSAGHIEVDRQVFAEIRRILKSDEIILLLRETSLVTRIPYSRLDPIYDYLQFIKRPESEFLIPTLEGLRVELNLAMRKLHSLHALETSPLEGNPEYSSVSVYTKMLDGGRHYSKIMAELDRASDEVCFAYDELIRQRRRMLLTP